MASPRADDDHQDEPDLVEEAFRQASFSMSVFDIEQRYRGLNDVACQVMGVEGEDALLGRVFPYGVPEDVEQRGLLKALRDVAATGEPTHFESFSRAPSGIREHAWNMELWPVRDASGEVSGVGLAAYDSSEQHWARQRLAVLDEAAVSIGTSLDLDRTAQELADLVVPRFADFASVDLLEAVMRGDEPADAGPDDEVVLRRLAHAAGRVGAPGAVLGPGATDTYPPYSPPARALRTGQPVLSRSGAPDFDQWMASTPVRARACAESSSPRWWRCRSSHAVRHSGSPSCCAPGPTSSTRTTWSWPRELATRAAVCIDNARRYTRERSTALALQRSLLPQRPLPAAGGRGRLPLPARRRARRRRRRLVRRHPAVRAPASASSSATWSATASTPSATMGTAAYRRPDARRRRPAARRTPHPPRRPGRAPRRGRRQRPPAATGRPSAPPARPACTPSTTRSPARCTVARAGHPPPAVVCPGRRPWARRRPAGPPLGVGGLPFETTEIELPEGSLLALYTDGLVEARRAGRRRRASPC